MKDRLLRNRLIAHIRPSASLLGIAGIVILGLFTTHFPIPAFADDPPAAVGEVLLYTDNSPGALVHAQAYLSAWRRLAYNVHVITSESEFIDTFPTQTWKHVLAVSRHTSAKPSYAGALRTYVGEGGIAHIQRWRDDPSSPAPTGSAVLAPMAIQVWMNGSTSTGYAHCRDSGSATSSSGLSFAGFNGLSLLAIHVLPSGLIGPLTPGVYAAMLAAPTTQECLQNLQDAVKSATDQFNKDVANCFDAYGPHPLNTPPSLGNPQKLTDCLVGFAQDLANEIIAANRRYRTCLDQAAN